MPKHLPGPEGDFQLEPAVGVAELVTEQVIHVAEPVSLRQHICGPTVTNISVQDQCPLDQADHLEIAYEPVAMADMLNALDPASPVRVPCVPVLALTGPIGPVPSF